MSNVAAVVVPPTSNTNGTGVSVATMGPDKTVIVGGTLVGIVELQASIDGGTTYTPIASFNGPGKKEVHVACTHLRCAVSGYVSGTATCDVSGPAAALHTASLNVPATVANGTSTDISAYGRDLSVQVSAITDGAVELQISSDDTDWHTIKTITKNGIFVFKGVEASYARVKRTVVSTGTTLVIIGAQNLGETSSVDTAQLAAGAVTPVKIDASSFFVVEQDFALASSGTLPAPHAKNLHGSATGDYLDDAVGGVYSLATEVTSEAQSAQLTWGDQLMLNPAGGLIFEARVRLNIPGATPSADERWVVGLCSAHANAEDSLDAVTSNVWFRGEGANLNIYVEGDDGATDTNDLDTTVNYVDNTWMLLKIDMTDPAAVIFSIDGVAFATTVDVTDLDATTPLQPIFCYQRDAGTEINLLEVDWYRAYQAR